MQRKQYECGLLIQVYHVQDNGTSPMYLAILLKNEGIVDKLYKMSDHATSLSYAGPNGPSALHAAATRGQGKMLAL